jgi:hypothetical protein
MGFHQDFLADKSKKGLLKELRRVASKLGKLTVSQKEFKEHGRVSPSTIENHFGTWNKGLKQAGLDILRRRDIPNADIIKEIGRVWSSLGHRPSYAEFDKLSKFSVSLLENRFGTFLNAMEAFLRVYGEPTPRSQQESSDAGTATDLIEKAGSPQEKRKSRRKYGAIISYRGMQHAPINELGVVFLFGMLSKELGFIVEAVGPAYPDCEAKRLDQSGESYEKVNIEFEYKSSRFKKHAKNAKECDLVVCWVHDWKACPVSVLELSKIVAAQAT